MPDHGNLPIPAGPLPDDDPDLLNIFADMETWSRLHPCECEGACLCDEAEVCGDGEVENA